MVGQTLGHYKILEKLGEGGMGEVYRAEDLTLKRQIALKILPSDVAGSQQRLVRFRREAEVVAGLNHPNIVVLHSVEEVDSLHFLTMELVEGKPLHLVIGAGGLPVHSYFNIAVPLADALSVAHEKGIVHRDLKPDNIMVSDRGVVKVLDFGLAKLTTEFGSTGATDLPTETLTSDGSIQGTVPYMSPEQVRAQNTDHQSDIFSLGVVLHEMATGKRLFRGESSADVITAILSKEPPPVSDARPDLPFHLSRIVAHCLVKDRRHRYQSTQDIRNELEGLQSEVQTGRIRTGSLTTPPLPESPRSRRQLRLIAGAALLVALAVVAFFWLRGPGTRASGYEAIAVMPFDNLTGDPSQDYVGEGLGAGLITQLSELSGLSVVGRSEVWSLRGKELSANQIGQRLGVKPSSRVVSERERSSVPMSISRMREPDSSFGRKRLWVRRTINSNFNKKSPEASPGSSRSRSRSPSADDWLRIRRNRRSPMTIICRASNSWRRWTIRKERSSLAICSNRLSRSIHSLPWHTPD